MVREPRTLARSSKLTSVGLADGDCGSVVIDRDTHTIYGHVIGSNPMDQAYVVPFKHIIEQIKLTFGTSKVSIYDATKTSQTVKSSMIQNTIELNSEDHAIVPYRRSDLCLSSSTKAIHAAGRSDSQQDHAAEDRDQQTYRKSYEAFACVCGRKYERLSASPLSLEEFFRKATRPTSTTEVLAFWLSLLDLIRPMKSVHCIRESVPKDSVLQKSLLCHRPERSIHGIRPEFLSLHVTCSEEGELQQKGDCGLKASDNAYTSNCLARIVPAAWSECYTSPCHYCQVRQNLQQAYYLFSIGGLLLESLVWVLTGHDGLSNLQQRRRNSNASLVGRSLQLFNNESVSLHAKAIANGDSTSLEVLQLTERILNQDLDFPELWRWREKMYEDLERRLNTMRRREPNFIGKRTSNKRALDSYITQNFARNPVIDPHGPDTKTSPKFRDLVRRVGHTLVRVLSQEPRPSVFDIRRDRRVHSLRRQHK